MSNTEMDDYVEIDLREYLEVLWKRKNLIIGIMLVFVLAGGLTTYYLIDPVYETKATVKLGTHKGEFSQPELAKSLLKSNNYLQRANKKMKRNYSIYELNKMANDKLEINNSGKLLTISFQDKQPQEAELILNTLIKLFKQDGLEEFDEIKRDKENQLAEINDNLETLNQKISQLNEQNEVVMSGLSKVDKIILATNRNNNFQSLMQLKSNLINRKYRLKEKINQLKAPQIIDKALVPQDPIKPKKILNLAISTILGLMVGIMAAFVTEFIAAE